MTETREPYRDQEADTAEQAQARRGMRPATAEPLNAELLAHLRYLLDQAHETDVVIDDQYVPLWRIRELLDYVDTLESDNATLRAQRDAWMHEYNRYVNQSRIVISSDSTSAVNPDRYRTALDDAEGA